jgi:error-prone DNA polymerase
VYVELHAHSGFSFLDGASLPDELASAAARLGYPAMALTDHDGVWGSMEFAQSCAGLGVRPITGAELTVSLASAERATPEEPFRGNCPPGCFHLTLLAETALGWRSLCRLLTIAHSRTREWNLPGGFGAAAPGTDPAAAAGHLAAGDPGLERRHDLLHPVLPLTALEAEGAAEGLVCLSGCARDGALAGRIARHDRIGAERLGRRLLAIFGPDHLRVELQRPLWRGDRSRNRRLAELAAELGVATVATGNVHFHDRRRAQLQDALVAARMLGTLESTEPERRGNGAGFLASPERMAERFAEHPEAVAETERLAQRLRFDLTRDLGYRYPGSEDPDADRKLAEVCAARFAERYDGTLEKQAATERLQEELAVIARLELSGFFLLHREILELARDVALEVRGPSAARALLPPGRGRGSSVSSVVCYLTGLSHVDPVKAGLFLGRFLNDEITDAPDIDLDFPRDVRRVLIPRIHERYGAERSALVAAFPTYRSRGAVRDLGGALGLPQGEIERVARSVDVYGSGEIEREIAEAIGEARARSERWRALISLAHESKGLPRHASQHPGGMILSTRPLTDLCPVVPAAMEGRRIAQWDKDSCADAGFLKIDLLGLGMLSAVERTVDEIARTRSEHVDLSRIPLDDAEVYGAIQRAETTGVFQIESRAQMQMLPRTHPENLDDITVQVALVRPGPIQGGAVHPYLERKRRLREDPTYEVPYAHPSLEPILSDTLGAIVFQDQVIQVAMALAGFRAGEAEGLRRAMSRKRSEEALNSYRGRFIEGAIARGVSEEVANGVYDQIKGFSGFGFPKSHAAAFGLLAYQSTWLRVHYGAEFLCGLLNEQPMGFYPPDALVHEAQRRGIRVLGPDVNASAVLCRCEWVQEAGAGDSARGADHALAVRIGLGYVTGLAEADAGSVAAARESGGDYRDLGDLAARSGASRDGLEKLAWADACAGIGAGAEQLRTGSGIDRRQALWTLGISRGARRHGKRGKGAGARASEQLPLPIDLPEAPPLEKQSAWEQVTADYSAYGISLNEHPMALIREELDPATVTSADLARIADGAEVVIAGMTVARQRPATANGVVFMLLEDEYGMTNVVVLPPVYERHRLLVRTAGLVSITGKLERREKVVNVVAQRLHELQRPDLPLADVRPLAPPVRRETGRAEEGDAGAGSRRDDAYEQPRRAAAGGGAIADLDAVLPPAHNFGRRGR